MPVQEGNREREQAMVRKIRHAGVDRGSKLGSLVAILCLLPAWAAGAQQPQAQSGQPIYSVNAKYVEGVGPGYWPTAGSGLTLNVAPGTAICDQASTLYPGGTLTLAASSTNYVYLDQSNNCAPASNTTGLTDVALAVASVVTGASTITSVTDLRTWFVGGKPAALNATRFPGANAGAKITAAIGAL